jgi:hypothetical protein
MEVLRIFEEEMDTNLKEVMARLEAKLRGQPGTGG